MARLVSGDSRLGFFFLCVVLAWATTASADNSTVTPTPSPTLSGCQVCASSGDCSHAYLDGPGQFCGNWLDQASQRQRCCCPRDASCRLSNYECRCSRSTPSPTRTTKAANVSTGGWAGVTVGAFMFMVCCTSACWFMHRVITRNGNNQRPQHATAVPVVYGQPGCNVTPAPGVVYGAPPAQYPYGGVPYAGVPTAPVYGYGYGNSYGNHHHSSGMSVGAVAGLATGMMIADVMHDSGNHHGDYGGGGYDGGGGGGYDGGGDSGGGGGDFGGDF